MRAETYLIQKKERSKIKFNSKYSPGKKITAAQYLTEFICERRSKNTGWDLPDKFWNLPNWSNFYKYQIIHAHKLLKKFDIDIIFQALKDKRCKYLSSLRSPFLEKICTEVKKNYKKPETKIDTTRIYDSKGSFNKEKTIWDDL